MLFNETYKKFMQLQLQARIGESLRRLQEGHAHAEKMFLELFGGRLSVDLIFFMPNIPFQTLRMVFDI